MLLVLLSMQNHIYDIIEQFSSLIKMQENNALSNIVDYSKIEEW